MALPSQGTLDGLGSRKGASFSSVLLFNGKLNDCGMRTCRGFPKRSRHYRMTFPVPREERSLELVGFPLSERFIGRNPAMQSIIRGTAYVVGDNVDTDQIIPAEYLSYNPADPAERKYFGRYAMSGVPVEASGLPAGGVRFVETGKDKSGFAVIIAGRNFGCGSSREHAPLAIAEAGVAAVVAESYARIFYRNSVNGGYLVPLETPVRLVGAIATGEAVELDCTAGTLKHLPSGKCWRLNPLGDAADIVAAGGVFEYARRLGMLK